MWTDAQLIRETIAGSWGVIPAKAAHVWRVVQPAAAAVGSALAYGRSLQQQQQPASTLWSELMHTGQVVFANDLIERAESRASAAREAGMGMEERERRMR